MIHYVEIASGDPAHSAFSFHQSVAGTFRTPASQPPHRHNYQEIILLKAGHGRHMIDGRVLDLAPQTVSLITKGQVHRFESGTDMVSWTLRFTDDFLPAAFFSPSWNYQATLFNHLALNPVLTIPPAQWQSLEALLALMAAEYTQTGTLQRENALRYLLSLVLIQIERSYQELLHNRLHEGEAYQIYQRFVTLLEERFPQEHGVNYYADTLHLAPIRLARILQRILGKTTKQVITERIILEAKRYLHYTSLSLKEIAAALGYSDSFHLSKTFKQCCGLAPQEYRSQCQKLT